jgi:Pyruvate/2-oxoacid:ferredoxin oxidoreductase delta subunit
MAKIIYDSGLEDFLNEISEEMLLYAPIYFNRNYHDQIAFRKWRPKSRLALKYPLTILPPKELLLPAKETLFEFQGEKAQPQAPGQQAIFGISLEDLVGIQRLDKIMSAPVQDEVYAKRREKTFIIGLDKFSPPSELGYDLYLQELEPGVYGAVAKSRQGKKWLATKHFKTQSVAISKVAKKADPLLSDPLLGRAIKESADHPIWEELSQICFGCGICSYICPLCYCFDTQDEVQFGNSSCGERCRQWDSCMLKNFAATNNHNFRPELKDRIYNWYYHKFYRMEREQGFNGCVDCSRCVVYCPAKINFRRVLGRVLNDYKKRPKK